MPSNRIVIPVARDQNTKRAVNTALRLGFAIPAKPEPRVNPFTCISVKLDPLACLLHDFIVTKDLTCGIEYTRQEWDLARQVFHELWPDAYYDLID
jgi:hypothetical protein